MKIMLRQQTYVLYYVWCFTWTMVEIVAYHITPTHLPSPAIYILEFWNFFDVGVEIMCILSQNWRCCHMT